MVCWFQQIKVEFSMKFTSRDLSLKRTPSKKQSGVFGVKINVVTKYENCPGFLDQKQKGHRRFGGIK